MTEIHETNWDDFVSKVAKARSAGRTVTIHTGGDGFRADVSGRSRKAAPAEEKAAKKTEA